MLSRKIVSCKRFFAQLWQFLLHTNIICYDNSDDSDDDDNDALHLDCMYTDYGHRKYISLQGLEQWINY